MKQKNATLRIGAKHKAVMVQGTGSTVGKSVICAALCRIFTQDGLNTNPFKSQNMALNSAITPDGHEMGRAQVMQAEACKKIPQALMNPLLLKPTSDKRSQIILCGKVYDTCDAAAFYAKKHDFRGPITQAYAELLHESDVVVLEGAGSPAEINLKQNDLVNMGMAQIARSPVLLVGDIDKGGVFASLVGTLALLEPEEKAHVKGFIINKFRGDLSLLTPGLRQLENLTGVPVLGVVPYFDLQLDDEDSVVDFQKFSQVCKDPQSDIDIAVVQLPYMSNFTDVNALALEPRTQMRFVAPGQPLGQPDMVLLPGTKNTMNALNALRTSGMDKQICDAHRRGAFIFGICGGYQLLGRRLEDPLHCESDVDAMDGLGLLNVSTRFYEEKTTRVSSAVDRLFSLPVSGYEIHMGGTVLKDGVSPFLQTDSGANDGAVSADGRVCGSYFHGIFDNGVFTRTYLNHIRTARGKAAYEGELVDYRAFKESQYDALAEHVRAHLDMEKIYEILERGMDD